MFSYFNMIGNYEDRKVARDEYPWGFISTASVTDGEKPFETAVQHSSYGRHMTIVENYSTREEAEAGHRKWVETMNAPTLPERLIDCNNAAIAKLASAFGANQDRVLQGSEGQEPESNIPS